MCAPLRAVILIMIGLLISYIIGGCTGNDPPEEITDPPEEVTDLSQSEYSAPPPATTVEVDPVTAHDIPRSTQFTLTFDEKVLAVWVNDIPACGSGKVWEVTYVLGPEPGGQLLHIEWANQDGSTYISLAGPYSAADIQFGPPEITHGTVFDGEPDVDPAPINIHGLGFDFNEAVTGTLKLTDEAGVDLNWIGVVRDKTAILVAVAGQELVHGTTYKIEIDLQDHSDHPLQTTITFVTRPK